MSNFNCEHCGAACIDSPRGYVTGCEHYPADIPPSQVRRCPWCNSAANAYYAGGAVAFRCGTSISATGSARGVQCGIEHGLWHGD